MKFIHLQLNETSLGNTSLSSTYQIRKYLTSAYAAPTINKPIAIPTIPE